MPTISVIVPVYKVEPYLHRCVDSILGQTFTDFELILVDDGSPDNCPAICDEYARKDSRVHVIHQENGGLSAARNAGIDYCISQDQSQYISFVDSDDYILPLYLEKLYLALVENGADVSICGKYTFCNQDYLNCTQNFSDNIILDNKQACRFIYTPEKHHATFVTAWAKLYKKELFSNIRFPVGKLHEDQFTTYKILYTAHIIVEIGDCLYGYFTNENGIMHSRFTLKRYDDLVAIDEAIAFFQKHAEDEISLAALERKGILLVEYSMLARKAGIYFHVPPKYRMPIHKADIILTLKYGRDYSEYYLYQYCPAYVKFKARFNRLLQYMHFVK